MKEITINMKTYPSMAAACKELNLSWHLLSKEDRIYTLEETSDKMFELGITKTRTTRSNIQQIEKAAIKKLKNILKDDEDVLLFLGLM